VRRIALLGVLGALICGCNPQDKSDLQRDASQLGKTATRVATNATVAGKVETALALRKGVNVKNYHIEADGAVVTISGHVESPLERQTVLDMANNTVGVNRVVDKLTMAATAPAKSDKG
jgi:osmotically-inducible protein OsmY